jgi:hypothetical protein
MALKTQWNVNIPPTKQKQQQQQRRQHEEISVHSPPSRFMHPTASHNASDRLAAGQSRTRK